MDYSYHMMPIMTRENLELPGRIERPYQLYESCVLPLNYDSIEWPVPTHASQRVSVLAGRAIALVTGPTFQIHWRTRA